MTIKNKNCENDYNSFQNTLPAALATKSTSGWLAAGEMDGQRIQTINKY